jgi:hypothetical protein
MRILTLAFIALLPLAAIAQSDTITVRIAHGDTCSAVVSLEQLRALPRHTATIQSHDGEEATYEGVLLKRVLGLGCPSIAAIGKRTMVRSAVRVSASDGYSALIAMAETDSTFRNRPVLLTWLKNGKPLDGHDGPLQLIVPDDNRHARDVRMVNRLEVITP